MEFAKRCSYNNTIHSSATEASRAKAVCMKNLGISAG